MKVYVLYGTIKYEGDYVLSIHKTEAGITDRGNKIQQMIIDYNTEREIADSENRDLGPEWDDAYRYMHFDEFYVAEYDVQD